MRYIDEIMPVFFFSKAIFGRVNIFFSGYILSYELGAAFVHYEFAILDIFTGYI